MNVTRDNMEIGIDSFAEAQLNNGKSYSENSAQSISDLLDRIEQVHPMKQITIMAVVQVVVFGFMLLSFSLINLGLGK